MIKCKRIQNNTRALKSERKDDKDDKPMQTPFEKQEMILNRISGKKLLVAL